MERCIFVAGCGHTGTSLLAALLGAHSCIYAIPFETGLFLDNAPERWNLAGLKAAAGQLPPGKNIILEKTPRHVEVVGRITEILPNARVLLAARDGRDVVASLKNRGFSLGAAIGRWVGATGDTLSCLSSPNVKLVRYEDLIRAPEVALEDICRFVGVGYEPAMLEFHTDNRNWFGERELKRTDGMGDDQHRALRNWQIHQPLFDGRGRWRSELDANSIRIFNTEAAELMEKLGYYDPLIGDLDTTPEERKIIVESGVVPEPSQFGTWSAQLHGETSVQFNTENRYDEFLDEKHHRVYGRPWCLGREYFEYLIMNGIRQDDLFLDFGCGTGRLGVPIIRYLEAGKYFGVDSHRESLDAFAEYEVPLAGISYKKPRLLHDQNCSISLFGTGFTVICDLYVTHHLPIELSEKFYAEFADHLLPGGRIFVPHPPRLREGVLQQLGLRILHTESRNVRFLEKSKKNVIKTDQWHILGRG